MAKKHNPLYSEIEICEENLNWMNGDEEANLKEVEEIEVEGEEQDEDKGPAEKQCIAPRECAMEDVMACGLLCETAPEKISEEDKELGNSIENILSSNKSTARLHWPKIGNRALSEYNPNIKIFCMAFPWLFPGGVGDYQDPKKCSLSQ